MATLRKISGNYYLYFYDKHRDPKKKSYALGVSRQTAAEEAKKRLEKKYAQGKFDPWRGDPFIADERAESISVNQAIRQFLNEKRSRVREGTVETYKQQLEAWEAKLPIGLMTADIRSQNLRPYVYAEGIANATKRKRYRHLRVFLNWACSSGYLDRSPLDDVQQPREKKKEKPVLTPGDMETLLSVIDEHRKTTTDAAGRKPDVQWLKDVIVISMYTGLRRGEIASALWKDVDLEAETLSVRNRPDPETETGETKTGDERTVPLRGPALDRVQRMHQRFDGGDEPAGDRHLIEDRNDDRVRPNRITQRFSDFVAKADIDDRVSFHTLRHSCVSMLGARGVPMRVIQEIVGHQSITTTERYSHLRIDTLADAMDEAYST
jgi:integrase